MTVLGQLLSTNVVSWSESHAFPYPLAAELYSGGAKERLVYAGAESGALPCFEKHTTRAPYHTCQPVSIEKVNKYGMLRLMV